MTSILLSHFINSGLYKRGVWNLVKMQMDREELGHETPRRQILLWVGGLLRKEVLAWWMLLIRLGCSKNYLQLLKNRKKWLKFFSTMVSSCQQTSCVPVLLDEQHITKVWNYSRVKNIFWAQQECYSFIGGPWLFALNSCLKLFSPQIES